jgi:hypothetical protein
MMSIFDLDVKTVSVGHNRVLWECALCWDDIALLIANPVCFVQSIVGRRLGDVNKYPIVVMNFSYPGSSVGERDDSDDSGSDVVVQGIDDTSAITVRVRRLPCEPLPDLQLDEMMKVQVALRLNDRLATAHFHLAGDRHGVKKETYALVRNPVAYAPALNKLVEKGLVEVFVIDDADCDRPVAKELEALDTVNSSNTQYPVSFSTNPTVRSLTVQYDSSTDEAGGCHSMDGTIGPQPRPISVNGTTVNCIAYAPNPPPSPTPGPPMSGAGMPA